MRQVVSQPWTILFASAPRWYEISTRKKKKFVEGCWLGVVEGMEFFRTTQWNLGKGQSWAPNGALTPLLFNQLQPNFGSIITIYSTNSHAKNKKMSDIAQTMYDLGYFEF